MENNINYEEEFKKDCSKYKFDYIPDTITQTSRTIAIGDIHGDLNLAIEFLIVAKCIELYCLDVNSIQENETVTINNRIYVWSGGDTQVVQVGDQVDRCRSDNCNLPESTINDEASDIKILKFYSDVNKMARRKGGRVISLLGNHELMNVMGNLNYVSFMGLLEFNNNVDMTKVDISTYINRDKFELKEVIDSGIQNRKNTFSNNFKGERKEALNEYLACSRTSAIIIGDLLFVHGGLIKKMAEAYKIVDLNRIVRKWLLGELNDETNSKILYTSREKINKRDISFNTNSRLHEILKSKNSIFWNRILGYLESDKNNKNLSIDKKKRSNKYCDEILKEMFKTVNINGIIIGHTPQMSEKNKGINSACDERVWRVDIGASSAFDMFTNKKRTIQVLEITYNNNNKPQFNILS
jgi:hypothetical protein